MPTPRRLLKMPPDDAQILARLWADGISLTEMSKRLGYSFPVVRRTARLLGLPERTILPIWTAEENDILRRYCTIETATQVARRIPTRTHDAVRAHAAHLGLRFKVERRLFSGAEDALIREYFGQWPIREWLHLLFDRDESSICSRANSLGLRSGLRASASAATRAVRPPESACVSLRAKVLEHEQPAERKRESGTRTVKANRSIIISSRHPDSSLDIGDQRPEV